MNTTKLLWDVKRKYNYYNSLVERYCEYSPIVGLQSHPFEVSAEAVEQARVDAENANNKYLSAIGG